MNGYKALVPRPRLCAFSSATITIPRRAGIGRRACHLLSSCVFHRYARVHADVLVAGSDCWSNYTMGALARCEGLRVALYHHAPGDRNEEFDQPGKKFAADADHTVVRWLAHRLNVSVDSVSREAVLRAFFSRAATRSTDISSIPPVVNLVGVELSPDRGRSTGLLGGELFWPIRPVRHASVESRQTVAAMCMPDLPVLRFGRRGCSFVTANHCVVTTPLQQFPSHDMRCATYQVSVDKPEAMQEAVSTLARSQVWEGYVEQAR